MPRRRRFAKSTRATFTDWDLKAGPMLFGPIPDEEAAARVDAMEQWYVGEAGEVWEREQAEEHPGRRSWSWWVFLLGEQDPFALTDEEKLRRIVVGGHLFEGEAEAIIAVAEHFNEHFNSTDVNGRRTYGEGGGEHSMHGTSPQLWPARVLREALGPAGHEGEAA